MIWASADADDEELSQTRRQLRELVDRSLIEIEGGLTLTRHPPPGAFSPPCGRRLSVV